MLVLWAYQDGQVAVDVHMTQHVPPIHHLPRGLLQDWFAESREDQWTNSKCCWLKLCCCAPELQ
jgi:hypothetical protein